MSHPPAPRRAHNEIVRLVEDFENGSLSPSEFNHHAHMTVALWYLMHFPYLDAAARMRANIRSFAALHHHDRLYNETITLFWMKLLRHVLDRIDPALSLADVVHHVLTAWGSALFMFKHYSRERILSEEARRSWVEPDLRPLGFEVA